MQPEFHIDYGPICNLYAQKQLTGTLYLAFRDIPQILHHYSLLKRSYLVKGLDFGCGAGVSTRYLKSLKNLFLNSLEVEGVDINKDMLNIARQQDPKGTYHLLKDNHIPVSDSFYDFIFSSFVLFEFASKERMKNALIEIRRVMKKDAFFIAATGSEELYKKQNQWVSFKNDFPQNRQLKSGDLGRVDFLINEKIITFENYYWTEKDYLDVFNAAGFQVEQVLHPLGRKEEEPLLSWHWKSEIRSSPYYIFVATPLDSGRAHNPMSSL